MFVLDLHTQMLAIAFVADIGVVCIVFVLLVREARELVLKNIIGAHATRPTRYGGSLPNWCLLGHIVVFVVGGFAFAVAVDKWRLYGVAVNNLIRRSFHVGTVKLEEVYGPEVQVGRRDVLPMFAGANCGRCSQYQCK